MPCLGGPYAEIAETESPFSHCVAADGHSDRCFPAALPLKALPWSDLLGSVGCCANARELQP